MVNWITQSTEWATNLASAFGSWLQSLFDVTVRDLILTIGGETIWGPVIDNIPINILDTPMISMFVFASATGVLVYCAVSLIKWLIGIIM